MTTTQLTQKYQSKRIKQINKRLDKIKIIIQQKKNILRKIISYRLISGLITISIATILMLGPSYKNWVWPFLGALFTFIILVFRSKKINTSVSKFEHYQLFLERQLNRLSNRSQLVGPSSIAMIEDSEKKILASDLQILGSKSLFNLINETFTVGGQTRLINQLTTPLNNIEEILKRTTQLKFLSNHHWILTRWLLLAKTDISTHSIDSLKDNLKNKNWNQKSLKKTINVNLVSYFFAFLSFVINALGIINFPWQILFGIYFIISIMSIGSLVSLYGSSESLSNSLNKISESIIFLEKYNILSNQISVFISENKPSTKIKNLSRILQLLSIQAHPIVLFLVNSILPWSASANLLLIQWYKKNSNIFDQTINEIENAEVLISLTLFSYYQSNIFPTFKSHQSMNAINILHPLLDTEKAVSNSFIMGEDINLTLITGSNMSGKSTFMRTMGINQQLALIGCPIFADEFHTYYAPVTTCLQITDSISEGFSSFYYEVLRVKKIHELLKSGNSHFYLIDEIFRGTNNRERYLGSLSILKEFIKYSQSKGIISTHDLELSNLENEIKSLQNKHFKDEINNNDQSLHFPYKIFEGPSTTTNALKLMHAAGLPVDH